MGSRDDRSSRTRMGGHDDTGHGGGSARAAPARAFDRDQDMGGSGWSGASGRGGMSYEGSGYAASSRGHGGMSYEGSGYAASSRGHGGDGGYAGDRGYADEHGHEGGYPGDRRSRYYEDAPGGYPGDRRFGHGHEQGYAAARPHYAHQAQIYQAHQEGRGDDAGFLEECGFGHVPGQRWSGGYGGDRDRSFQDTAPRRDSSGRGFTGSDFGGLPRDRERHEGAPAGPSHEARHFGTVVDRGGRLGAGGAETRQGGHWAWSTAKDRGPHWGKGPKGYTRSDAKTRDEVCDAIANQGHIDASDVEVNVESGVVILTGTVAQRHHKRALEQLVERCRGVHEVHNELRLSSNRPRTEPTPLHAGTGLPAPPRSGNGNPRNGGTA